MKNKKAQLQGLSAFVMALIVISVVLAIGLIVLTELGDTAKTIEPQSAALNETIATSGDSVRYNSLFTGITACRNLTSGVLTLGLTCNASSEGVVTFAGNGLATSDVYVDYSHYTASAAYISTSSIITKLATVPTWLGIIIVVSLAMIVLTYFYAKRQ